MAQPALTGKLPEKFVFRPKTVDVQSFTDPTKVYEVTLPHCTCPDMQFRDKGDEVHLCKHILAAYGALHGFTAVAPS